MDRIDGYFENDQSNFQDLCINEIFLSTIVTLPSNGDLTTTIESDYLAHKIIKRLRKKIQRDSILMVIERQHILLFGLMNAVNELIQQIKAKHSTNIAKLALQPQQIIYLINVCHDELKRIESFYSNVKILDHIMNGEFSAPNYLHNRINNEISQLATLCEPMNLEIRMTNFSPIESEECAVLVDISHRCKCHIELQIENTNQTYTIAKSATTQNSISNDLLTTAIEVRMGDLFTEKVDLVIVCSISNFSQEDILSKADEITQHEYAKISTISVPNQIETNAGQLSCSEILFLHCEIDELNDLTLYRSTCEIVRRGIQHAISAHYNSVAFSPIYCEELDISKDLVADAMLIEAQTQLLLNNTFIPIKFIFSSNQVDLFETFRIKLDSLQKIDMNISNTKFTYPLTVIKAKIISSTKDRQNQCKIAIDTHLKKYILIHEYYEDILKRWTQSIINKFYRYCLNRHVLPEMDPVSGYLKLSGPKECIMEAENEFYRIMYIQSEEARLIANTSNIIWAYEISNDNWKKYTSELNARIEHAYASNLSLIEFINEKHEHCRIDFKNEIEICLNNQRQRQIIRQYDIGLPRHWQIQVENVRRVILPTDINEYNDIYIEFHQAMIGKYTEIVRIERIQNKQWYVQYNAYKKLSKNPSERKFYHACSEKSANQIIHSFFNRSFAGTKGVTFHQGCLYIKRSFPGGIRGTSMSDVHSFVKQSLNAGFKGTAFGKGIYFTSDAAYAHSFTRANELNGERCMFLATVVLGETMKGKNSMTTPPTGYDSTTDGHNIFVTYRDNQAYAAYLIVYR